MFRVRKDKYLFSSRYIHTLYFISTWYKSRSGRCLTIGSTSALSGNLPCTSTSFEHSRNGTPGVSSIKKFLLIKINTHFKLLRHLMHELHKKIILIDFFSQARNRYKHWSPTASFKQSDVEFTYTVTFPSSLVSREDDWTVSIIDGFTVTIIKFVDPPYVWYGGFDLRDKVLDDTVYRCFSGDFNTLELKIAKTYKGA